MLADDSTLPNKHVLLFIFLLLENCGLLCVVVRDFTAVLSMSVGLWQAKTRLLDHH